MNPIVAIQKSITAQANRATRLPSPVAQFRTFLRLNDKNAGKPAEVPPPAEGDKPNGETPPPPPPPPEQEGAQGTTQEQPAEGLFEDSPSQPATEGAEGTTEGQPTEAAPEVPPPAEGEGEAQGASEVADEGQGSATDEGAEGKQDAPAKKRRGRK